MDSKTIKLECVKLAFRHDRSPAEVVAVAKILEEYVNKEALSSKSESKKAIKRSLTT